MTAWVPEFSAADARESLGLPDGFDSERGDKKAPSLYDRWRTLYHGLQLRAIAAHAVGNFDKENTLLSVLAEMDQLEKP